jgi:LysR family transcriptional regulator for metE and metH
VIEIRHLSTLLALSESGSVSSAAARLHLTQSAVSHQLAALEGYFGVKLVDRGARPVRILPAGQRVLELAQSVLPQVRAAERELTQLAAGSAGGVLRIAIECHTCFDWLMPVMDTYRQHWPQVELDLVSGFHPNPLGLLSEGQADLVVLGQKLRRRGVVYAPLFRFEILGLMAVDHPLARRAWLRPEDFAAETLITYPVPPQRIDLMRQVLKPRGIRPRIRTAELTIAILQLVASRRGLAALPGWGVQNYVQDDYVAARRIGKSGLWSDLYAATRTEQAATEPVLDFIRTLKDRCFATLPGLVPIAR